MLKKKSGNILKSEKKSYNKKHCFLFCFKLKLKISANTMICQNKKTLIGINHAACPRSSGVCAGVRVVIENYLPGTARLVCFEG